MHIFFLYGFLQTIRSPDYDLNRRISVAAELLSNSREQQFLLWFPQAASGWRQMLLVSDCTLSVGARLTPSRHPREGSTGLAFQW